jgi:rhodanese-related sulfurtransferase
VTTRPTIDDLLAQARRGLHRLRPDDAAAAVRDGGVLVDIRPAAQRLQEGEVPGSLVVERNVLEWRFDPGTAARLAIASHDLQVIVLCSQGYTSSLAAASLQQLGIHRATDVVGGFESWSKAGLPVAPGGLLPRHDLAPGTLQLAADATVSGWRRPSG